MKKLINISLCLVIFAMVGCQKDTPNNDTNYIQNISVSINSDITADFNEVPFSRATVMSGNSVITKFDVGDSLSLSFQGYHPAFKIGYDGKKWNAPENIPLDAINKIQMELFNNAGDVKDAQGKYYDVLVMNGSRWNDATKTLSLELGHYYAQTLVNIKNVEDFEEIKSITAIWEDEAGRNPESITFTQSADKAVWSAITQQGTIMEITYTYTDGTEVKVERMYTSVNANKSALINLSGIKP